MTPYRGIELITIITADNVTEPQGAMHSSTAPGRVYGAVSGTQGPTDSFTART